MKNRKYLVIATGFLMLAISGCKKDSTYRAELPSNELPYSIYEYMERQGTGFDSLLFIINKAGLKDTLSSQNVTFFIPTDESIIKAVTNYNDRRVGQGLPRVSLKDIDSSSLRQIMFHYIIRGSWTSENLAASRDGLLLKTVGDRVMHATRQVNSAEGVAGGGSTAIKFSFTYSSKWIENWSSCLANTIDLKLANGVAHILEAGHVMSFGNFHVRAAATQNYWSDYYYYSSGTLFFPNGTSRPWGPLATANMRNGKRVAAVTPNAVVMDGVDFIGDPIFRIRLTIDAKDSVVVTPADAAADITLKNKGRCYFDRNNFTFFLDYEYSRADGLRRIVEEVKLSKN